MNGYIMGFSRHSFRLKTPTGTIREEKNLWQLLAIPGYHKIPLFKAHYGYRCIAGWETRCLHGYAGGDDPEKSGYLYQVYLAIRTAARSGN